MSRPRQASATGPRPRRAKPSPPQAQPKTKSAALPRRRAGAATRPGSPARSFTSRKKAERKASKQDLIYALAKRVRELSTLHSLARLFQLSDRPTANVLQETAALLPCAWQYPEIASCRIRVDGIEAVTTNFAETPWTLSASFLLADGRAGNLEVAYLEPRPNIDGHLGPFLLEEQALLDSAAEMLAAFLSRGQDRLANAELEERVNERTAQLQAMNEELAAANEELETEMTERVRVEEQLVEALGQEQVANAALESAQKELAASEARYRAIGETIPFGIWFADPQGGMTYLSQSFLDLVGMRMEECWGFGWTARLTPQKVERTLADWKECVERQGDWNYEYRILGTDGEYHTILSRGIPLRGAGGQVVGWGGRHLDITDRKRAEEEVRELNRRLAEHASELEAANEQFEVVNEELRVSNEDLLREIVERERAEQALRQSEERFRSLAENIPSVLMRYNREMQVVYLSPPAARITGIPIEQFVGKTNRQVGMPEHLCDLWENAIGQVFRSGERREVEFDIAAADGTVRTFDLKLAPEFAPDGRTVAHVLGISTDLTERKRAETLNAAVNSINILIHSTRDNDEIMQKALTQAAEALGCDSAGISLRKDHHWIVSYVHGLPLDMVGTEMSDDEERHAVLAIETKEPVAIEDAFTDERVNRQHMRHWGVRSVLVVPLIVKQEVIGILSFNYQQALFPFREYHLDFGDKVAASLALAVENARLFTGLAAQVTERQQMVAAIGASEERYRRLVDLSPDGVMVHQDGRIAFINSAGTRLFGANAEFELIGKPILDIVHPDYHELVRSRVQAVVDTGEPAPLAQLKLIRLDGTLVDVEATGMQTEHAGKPAVQVVFHDITQRKRSEDALRESEERYRRLVELAPDGILIHREGKIVFGNLAGARLLGAETPAELAGKTLLDFVHPDYRDAVKARVRGVIAEGETAPLVEEKLVRLDGEIIDAEVTAIPHEHEGHRSVQVVFRDITRRKWIESERERLLRELEAERARWQVTVQSMLDAVLVSDAEGRLAYANPAAEQLIGWPLLTDHDPKEHPTLHHLYHADGTLYQGRELPLEKAFFGGHAVTNEEMVHRLPDGRERIVLWNAAPLRSPSGRIAGSVAVGRDITEQRRADQAILTLNQELQKRAEDLEVINEELQVEVEERERAEEALRLGEERFRMAIRGSNVSLFCQDQNLSYTWLFNPSPGFTAEGVVGKNDDDLYPPLTAELLGKFKRSVLENGVGTRVQVPLIHPDGLHQFDMWIEPQRDPNGNLTGIIGAAVDVTEQAQIQEEIEKLNKELERRATDLEAANHELEAFAYSVSHDLRMPLSSIDGFTRMLIEDHAEQLPPDAQRFLQLIHQNAVSMQKLMDDLLAFSRSTRQPLKKETVAPTLLVQTVLEELRSAYLGRQVEMTVSEMPAFRADPALFKQVYANLIMNALKFTRRREVTRIEIGCEHCEGEEVPAYYVRDNGVGFDMENAERLFGVFQRFHRAEDYEGSGVGLAIVERIIRRHGGRIWADAAVDRGATFYFTLP